MTTTSERIITYRFHKVSGYATSVTKQLKEGIKIILASLRPDRQKEKRMLLKTYKAPNAKHYALDAIRFFNANGKVNAELQNTRAGLVLTCTSKLFVRKAAKLALAYYREV